MNIVGLAGNATRDPETHTFGEDNSVTKFGLAWNQRKKSGDDWIDVAHFFDITVWGNYGQLIASKLRKGDFCSVEGRLNFETWEGDDGKRSKVSITANKVEGDFQYRKKGEAPATDHPLDDAEPKQTKSKAKASQNDEDIPF